MGLSIVRAEVCWFAELDGEISSATVHRPRSCIRVGEVSLALEGFSGDETPLGWALEKFRSEDRGSDIEVSVEWREKLRTSQDKTAFDSGGVWTLFHDGTDFVFDFCSPILSVHPYKRLRMDRHFRTGQVTLSREALEKYDLIFPLEYPADELLITNYLASHGLGVEVHGCGIVDAETGGHLFLGHSGAGKSTTTKLWKSLRNPEILSDDRIILRLHDGELWMYGTPWHGEAAFVSTGKARLNRIFILQHGDGNDVVEISRVQAVGELFARCFPPFHSAGGLTNTLEFLHHVISLVPCYEFHFLPDVSAVEAALAFHG